MFSFITKYITVGLITIIVVLSGYIAIKHHKINNLNSQIKTQRQDFADMQAHYEVKIFETKLQAEEDKANAEINSTINSTSIIDDGFHSI